MSLFRQLPTWIFFAMHTFVWVWGNAWEDGGSSLTKPAGFCAAAMLVLSLSASYYVNVCEENVR